MIRQLRYGPPSADQPKPGSPGTKGANATHAWLPQLQSLASLTSNCVAGTPPSVVCSGGETTKIAGCDVNHATRSPGSGSVRRVPGAKTSRMRKKSNAPARSEGPSLISSQSLVSLFPVHGPAMLSRILGWNAVAYCPGRRADPSSGMTRVTPGAEPEIGAGPTSPH